EDSLQTLELFAVCWAFQNWYDEPLNVVLDSLYVVGVVSHIEDSFIREIQKPRLLQLFLQLGTALVGQQHDYCIIHVRSHQFGKGLCEGNALADKLASTDHHISHQPLSVCEKKVKRGSIPFHQNARSLRKQFKLTHAEATGIVQACPICSNMGLRIGLGVNPRGLKALDLWQMDVTDVQSFGCLKYVHVCVDTFSKIIWATAKVGETAKHVCKHLTCCFAVMGVPQNIKTDNGPVYASDRVRTFMKTWGVNHRTGIAHSPTDQAIAERAHQTLKCYLEK
ncbi:hypothetical protein N300_07663, partial [Calypte anna]